MPCTQPALFDLNRLQQRLISSVSNFEREKKGAIKHDNILPDLPIRDTFTSGKRHTDVTPKDLCERWFISYRQAVMTLKKTTQTFVRSAILPL